MYSWCLSGYYEAGEGFRVSGVGPEPYLAVFTSLSAGLALFGGGTDDLVVGEKLVCQVAVGFGAAGANVVKLDGLAVAWGFGKPYVARDSGLVELVAEEAFEIFSDLLGEVGALVVHGEDDALEFQFGIKGLLDAADSTEELADAFKG